MSNEQNERLEEFIRCVEELDYTVDEETLEQLIIELKGESTQKILLSTSIEEIVNALNEGIFRNSPCCRAEFKNDHTLWIVHNWYTDWVHIVIKIYRYELIVKKIVYGYKIDRPNARINRRVTHDGSIENIVEEIHSMYYEYKYDGSRHTGIY
ncbi:hypothetical protein PV-S19_0419 [Pacmanvirus S19]|nr:hypothetical protein PV-S19_0419 [Pacmanvirus S19]